MDWNGPLDYWNGIREWTTGLLELTKISKGPACPDIENEDLLSTSRMHRADLQI